MGVPLKVSIWIDQPRQTVWDLITDVDRWTEYIPGMVAASVVGDGEVGVGTEVDITIAFLGSTQELRTSFTRFEPPAALGSANIDGPMQTNMLITLTEENGGTRMSRSDSMVPVGIWAHIAAPVIAFAVERQARLEFDNIKQLLETGSLD